MQKQKIGLVFGGKSGEHEVSVRSAESIRSNLDRDKYEVIDIFVAKNGKFDLEQLQSVDVVFPIIHGTYGEDGSFQGLFEVFDLAYVGAGVLASAMGMDKDIMKRLLSLKSDLNVGKWIALKEGNHTAQLIDFCGTTNWPLFVKPANLGSSVGVSRCENITELQNAVLEAFKYDRKVLVEEYIAGREIECSIFGNTELKVSVPGEIKVHTGFYDYKSKYQDAENVELIVPAQLDPAKVVEIQNTALKVYETLECRGMARVDLFLKDSGEIVVNEINTLPGFTHVSMYPKLWEATGMSYPDLLNNLINLALEEKKAKNSLVREYIKA